MPSPSPLFARPPADPAEERRIRKLANARHAPASWRQRAQIVAASWDGAQVTTIADGLACHPMRRSSGGCIGSTPTGSPIPAPRSGRPPRLGELDRGRIIALARSIPPGRRTRQADGTLGLAAPDQVFIPKGACWLNLQEAWWRLFRRTAFAGQTLTCAAEAALATTVATGQLNARARPWVWGRPPPSPRRRRKVLTYRI